MIGLDEMYRQNPPFTSVGCEAIASHGCTGEAPLNSDVRERTVYAVRDIRIIVAPH